MALITLTDAKAWTESTKVGDEFNSLDADLERQVRALVLARLAARFDITAWVDSTSTPRLVRTIVAMYYVSFLYDRVYSTDDELNAYAELLRRLADQNIDALVAGLIDLDDDPNNDDVTFGNPAFYPNDASSALSPTFEDSSLGPASFSMGTVF